jgi:two-component system, OmpR family, sensor histidine kinase KdpD
VEEISSKKKITFEVLEKYILALIVVAAATAVMFAIGRDTLGEGVIALVYLAPISWVTARWGQGPGIFAAVTCALAFNYFFIPPYYTFFIGSLEGWLLLVIFLAVAIVIVGRIQVGLAMAHRREREAIFMHELSAALVGVHNPDDIANILAGQILQLYQAEHVQVIVEGKEGQHAASLPQGVNEKRKPDRILPILSARGMVGEIRLWQGKMPLPPEDDRLLRNFSYQGALAIERA